MMKVKFAVFQKISRFLALSSAACVMIGFGSAVHAQALPAYPTAAVASSTAWGPDRYAPAVFANVGTLFGRDNVLQIGIAAADADGIRPGAFAGAFYNMQGRKLLRNGLNSGSSWTGSVYIPAAWATTNPGDALLNRRSDVWATVSPATGGDTCPASNCNLFPIIGFSNAHPTTPLTNGGTARFRAWDGSLGQWFDSPVAVNFDTWTELGVTYTGTSIEFYVNGSLIYTRTNLTQGDNTFGPPARIGDIFFQAYNFGGANYDVYWSRAAAGVGAVSTVLAAAFPLVVTPLTVTPVVANNGFSSAGTIWPNTPFTISFGTRARIDVSTQFRYIAKVSGDCPAGLVGATAFVPQGSGNTTLVTDPLGGSCTAIITFVPTIPKVAVFAPADAPASAPQNASITFKAIISGATNAEGTVAFFVDGTPLASCPAQPIVQRFSAYDEQERAVTCTTTLEPFGVGQHFISAQYSGNVHNFPAGSAGLSYVVNLARYNVMPVLVTAVTGAMGSVVPAAAQSIEINKQAEFKISAPPKHIASIAGSTCAVGINSTLALTPQGAGNTTAITDPIKKDCIVRISFVPIQPVVAVTVNASAKVGAPLQISAGVTFGASASGTIAFYENDVLISTCATQTIVTTFTVDMSTRTAVCVWVPTQSGLRNISARYAGDTFNFAAVSGSIGVSVAP